MNILMLSSSYPKYHGDMTAPFIEEIAQGTQAQGHSVTILLPHHPELNRQPNENGVQIVTFKYTPFKKWHLWGYAASMQGDVKLKKAVYLLLPFVLIACFWKMWRLTTKNRYDLIQAHWVIPNAPIAVLIGWLRRTPVVISLHGSDVYVAEKLAPAKWLARWAFKRAKAVTASSPDLLSRAQKLGAPQDPERARFIPYGANVTGKWKNSTLTETRSVRPYPTLVCVGRLVYKKGFEYAIKALPEILTKFPDTRLLIAGKGDLEAELKELARKYGVAAQVEFVGVVAHDQIPAFLAESSVFLLPSIVDDNGNVDGLPNTLLEAMTTGCAIVASKVAGVPEVIQNGHNGLLVPQRDSQALARAIISLLADAQLRRTLGRNAHQTVVNQLSWQAIVSRYIEVFSSENNLAQRPSEASPCQQISGKRK
jgi:glycosyltransferase involved in cell wall biosynthesis